MKKQTRPKFAAAFKGKVALEAVKNQQTLAELAKKFEVNPIMISRWKAMLLANMGSVKVNLLLEVRKGAIEKGLKYIGY